MCVCVCLGLRVSETDCRDQMCVLHVCVNKESDMYTQACTYLLPGLPLHVFLEASLFLEAPQVSELERLTNLLSLPYALNR